MAPPAKNDKKESLDWISQKDSTNLMMRCMALEPKESTAYFYEEQSYEDDSYDREQMLADLEAKLNDME